MRLGYNFALIAMQKHKKCSRRPKTMTQKSVLGDNKYGVNLIGAMESRMDELELRSVILW